MGDFSWLNSWSQMMLAPMISPQLSLSLSLSLSEFGGSENGENCGTQGNTCHGLQQPGEPKEAWFQLDNGRFLSGKGWVVYPRCVTIYGFTSGPHLDLQVLD